MSTTPTRCIAFNGTHRIAFGSLAEVAAQVKAVSDADREARILVFDAQTSQSVEIDCRGSLADVLGRLPANGHDTSPTAEEPPQTGVSAGRGRPRLGVVAREVTLLPRHWEWLSGQPGGASVALRKLVEQARRDSASADRLRQAQEAAFRFMSAMAGDLAAFEEATRALFASDRARFEILIAGWPTDLRDHLQQLADAAFQAISDIDHGNSRHA